MRTLLVLIVAGVSLSHVFIPKNLHPGDTNMGYIHGIKVHQAATDYLVESGFRDEPVSAHFLMNVQLTNHRSRYLEKDEKFRNVTSRFDSTIHYLVYSSFEQQINLEQTKKDFDLKLLQRFDHKSAYTEIYENMDYYGLKPDTTIIADDPISE